MPKKLELGLIVMLTPQIESSMRKIADLGMTTCQMQCWQPRILNEKLAETVVAASGATGVRVSSYWAGHSGKTVWNFLKGPTTIGLVPPRTRATRVAQLQRGADFASWIGAPSISTHVGFLPENPNHPEYRPLIKAIGKVARHCERLGLDFCFETGQETPVTLLRVIEDLKMRNLGINLDPANLILYGKGNPVDALDVFGRYVQGVHAKDGEYPTNGRNLGVETPLGKGKVDFPVLIKRLKRLGYRGPLTIEREISGPKQIRDIRSAMRVLEPLR